jgi:hypothetical protein
MKQSLNANDTTKLSHTKEEMKSNSSHVSPREKAVSSKNLFFQKKRGSPFNNHNRDGYDA